MSLGHGLGSLIPKKSQPLSQPEEVLEAPVSAAGSLRDGYEPPPRPPVFSPPAWEVREEERRERPPRGGAGGREEAVFHIEIDKIRPNPYQPRTQAPDAHLEELAQSIREHGVLQPVVISKVVRETETGAAVEYQLIAGERRLLAARLSGLERIPAIVRAVDGERAKLELALVENIQRSDLTPLEAARAYARLGEEFGLTQREIAVRVGKSRETVANALRLLSLPREAREALAAGRISESQARALLAAEDPAAQARLLDKFLTRGGGVHAPRARALTPETPEQKFWERRLEEKFGAPVRVVKKGSRGKIEMWFQSEEEWQGLVEKLAGGEGKG